MKHNKNKQNSHPYYFHVVVKYNKLNLGLSKTVTQCIQECCKCNIRGAELDWTSTKAPLFE